MLLITQARNDLYRKEQLSLPSYFSTCTEDKLTKSVFCQAIVDISWRTMTMLPLDLLHCRHHRQLLQVTLKSSVQVELYYVAGFMLEMQRNGRAV